MNQLGLFDGVVQTSKPKITCPVSSQRVEPGCDRKPRRRRDFQNQFDFGKAAAATFHFGHIKQAVKNALLTAKITKDFKLEKGLAHLLENGKDPIRWTWMDRFEDKLKEGMFTPYLPALTFDSWHSYIEGVQVKRGRKHPTYWWRVNKETGLRHFNECRIQNLPGLAYEDFALKFWEGRHKPMFGKKIVTGVTWGRGWIEREKGYRGRKNGPIKQRVLGVSIRPVGWWDIPGSTKKIKRRAGIDINVPD